MENENYLDSDGLMHCGVCHAPIEMYLDIPFFPEKRKVRIVCKCEQEKIEEEQRKEKLRREREIIMNLRELSLLDHQYENATFDNFRITPSNRKVFDICKQYVEHFDEMMEKNHGMLFYGPTGTGKTYAAACIANELINRKRPVVVTSFVKLLNRIETTRWTDGEEALISQINRAHLLVIDDLGVERGSDYILERVYNIIDSRNRTGRPVILTTNLDLQHFLNADTNAYKRIYERIIEMTYPVVFNGASFRMEEAKQKSVEMRKILGV